MIQLSGKVPVDAFAKNENHIYIFTKVVLVVMSINVIHRATAANSSNQYNHDESRDSNVIELQNMGDCEKGETVTAENDEDYSKTKDKLFDDLLGRPISGYRLFFYNLDPFKAEQFVRAPKLFDDINIYFGIIYFSLLIIYSVYAILVYVYQKPIQVNSMVTSSTLDSIHLSITSVCNVQYGCGNWTGSNPQNYVQSTSIQLISNWNSPDSGSCYKNNQVINVPASPLEKWNYTFPVCYSSSQSDSVQLIVPFNQDLASSAFYKVTIFGDSQYYSNQLFFEITLRPSEWKTVYLSQTKTTGTDKSVSYAPYIGDLFYNGHSIDNNDAKVTFKLQQFGYTITSTYAESIFAAFGSIGGFSSILLAITGMMRGVIVMTYKSIFVLRDNQARGGLCVNAFQLFYISILRCCGLVQQ